MIFTCANRASVIQYPAMNPITHFLGGWALTLPFSLERRDRALVVAAAVVPDVDSFGLLIDLAQGRQADALELWSRYHHTLGHNICFAAAFTVLCAILARRKCLATLLAVVAIHMHFVGDIVGARGPDGCQWPIPYLLPFSDRLQLVVGWQWALNAWPNVVLTVFFIVLSLWYAWLRGISPLGLVSARADRTLVKALRKRFWGIDIGQN